MIFKKISGSLSCGRTIKPKTVKLFSQLFVKLMLIHILWNENYDIFEK